MADPLDEVIGETPDVVEAPAEQPEPEVQAEAPADPQPRDTGETQEVATPPVETPPEDPKAVPITALLEEREKRQEFARRVAELEAKVKAFKAKPVEPVDPIADPQGFAEQIRREHQAQLAQVRAEASRMTAEVRHGADTVKEALEAFQAAVPKGSAIGYEMANSADPYGYMVQWHQQQRLLAETGGDLTSYREKLMAEAMEKARAELLQQQTPPPAPPKSIAAAPGVAATTTPLSADPLDDILG